MAVNILQVDLTPDLDARIRAEARQRGVSPSEIVRRLLEELFPAPTPQDSPKRNVMDFAGIGSGAWQGVDVSLYIDEMRDEWDQTRD